ncbi:MAG: hypothetical protein KGJ60_00890 [Verrucomicrobiota bacterium]|nr:hypothetical protein [Verrucomicrobiota bacterium]
MNKVLFRILAFATIFANAARGQGTFQNLDFESAKLIFPDPSYPYFLAATNALPGWSAFSGTNQLTGIYYDEGAVLSDVMLFGFFSGVLSGNFDVSLAHPNGSPSGSISQTGLVPSDAQSLFFEASTAGLLLSMNGQNLSYLPISNGQNSSGYKYTVYGANISAFAGQSATLTFSTIPGGGAFLDNIQFSSQPIPEPSALSFIFLCCGILVSLRACRRQRLRSSFHRTSCR